jgi:hypothetical protein
MGLSMIDRTMLVGTWQMLSCKNEFTDTGEIVDVLGPDPVGFISYGADGRMQVIAHSTHYKTSFM